MPDRPMAEQVEAFDWSATPLGPMARWPPALRSVTRLALASRFPMFLGLGPDLLMVYNDAYAPILGAKHPAALGRPTAEVWSEIWDVIGPLTERVTIQGEATWSDDQLLVMDRHGFAEETYFVFTYSPIMDEDGHVQGLFCACSETTERVLAERRLARLTAIGDHLVGRRDRASALDAMVDALSEPSADLPAVVLIDPGDRPTVARAVRWAGPESVVGDPDRWGLVPGGDVTVVEDLALPLAVPVVGGRGVTCRRAVTVALRHPTDPRPLGWAVFAVAPWRDLDEDYLSFLRLLADQLAGGLSDAEAFAAERHRAEELDRLDRAKTIFFSNISHEFRTPLTLMLGPLADALSDPDLPPTSRDQVDGAHRNGRRLLKLVNELLEFARLEAGRSSAAFTPADLGSLTGEIVALFESAFARAGIDLHWSSAPVDEEVWVDPDLWERIVVNLVGNALKFTHEGSVSVSVHRTGEAVVLEVEDTGVGIDEADLPHLFERFSRIEQAGGRSIEGSGIGLAMVHELVELHGGAVTALSTPGEGSCFTVTLPLGTDHLPPDALHEHRGWVPGEATVSVLEEADRWLGTGTAPPADRLDATDAPLVLVVDDNEDMRDHLHRVLSARYRVVTAVDGQDALEVARSSTPDLVVADVMMPRLDGLGLVRALRDDPGLRQVPVLLASARAGEEAAAEGLDLGADDYLVKPFSSRELLSRAHARLAGSRRADEASRRLAVLEHVTAGLAEATSVADVPRLVHAAIDDDDLAFVGIAVHDPVDDTLVLSQSSAAPAERRLRYERMPVDGDLPMPTAHREGHEVVVESLDEIRDRFPTVATDLEVGGFHALAALPLVTSDGARLGAFGLGWRRPVVSESSLTLARDLVVPLAAVVAHLWASDAERRVSTALQRNLLRVDLTSTAGVLATRYEPAAMGMAVGGDWFDAVELADGRLALIVGDVVGHGIEAAAVMATLRSTTAALAFGAADPAEALTDLHRYAHRLPGALCTTVALAIVDPAAETISVSSAGHPPPAVVTPDGRASLLEGGRSWPLLVGNREPEVTSAVHPFPAGSLAVLYTDGLVERRDEHLDVGFDRLLDVVAAHRDLPVDAVCDRVLEGLVDPGRGPADDVALLAFRTVGVTSRRLTTAWPGSVDELAAIRGTVRTWLDEADTPDVDGLLIGLGEAAANAVIHGSGRNRDRPVWIEGVLGPAAGQVHLTVSDTGRWTPPDRSRAANWSGFSLMRATYDQIDLRSRPEGTTVHLTSHGQDGGQGLST